jgi:hypothetical protein
VALVRQVPQAASMDPGDIVRLRLSPAQVGLAQGDRHYPRQAAGVSHSITSQEDLNPMA